MQSSVFWIIFFEIGSGKTPRWIYPESWNSPVTDSATHEYAFSPTYGRRDRGRK